MAAVALAISGGGALSSLETTVLLTVEESMEALQKAGEIRYQALAQPRHGAKVSPEPDSTALSTQPVAAGARLPDRSVDGLPKEYEPGKFEPGLVSGSSVPVSAFVA